MKIEDLHYDLTITPIDKNNWNWEQWHKDCPMDYLKAIYILNMADNSIVQSEVFKAIWRVAQMHIPNVLYKYYSLSDDVELNEKKFQTLNAGKIFMSEIKDFNDPYDSKCFFYDSAKLADIERLKPHGGKVIDDFTTYIRGTALTENGVQSMPMWAHYSNNHSGFCVSYDMNANTQLKGCTFPVQYIAERLDITSLVRKQSEQICAAIDSNIAIGEKQTTINDLTMILVPQLLYNLKLDQWNYEKEFRCSRASNAKGTPYTDAIPKEIYIGKNCSEGNKKQLVHICQIFKIPAYQMMLDECEEKCELTSKRIL